MKQANVPKARGEARGQWRPGGEWGWGLQLELPKSQLLESTACPGGFLRGATAQLPAPSGPGQEKDGVQEMSDWL